MSAASPISGAPLPSGLHQPTAVGLCCRTGMVGTCVGKSHGVLPRLVPATQAVRGKRPNAFDGRCIPADCASRHPARVSQDYGQISPKPWRGRIAPRSITAGIVPRHAWSPGRIACLGASGTFTTDYENPPINISSLVGNRGHVTGRRAPSSGAAGRLAQQRSGTRTWTERAGPVTDRGPAAAPGAVSMSTLPTAASSGDAPQPTRLDPATTLSAMVTQRIQRWDCPLLMDPPHPRCSGSNSAT